MKRVFFTSLVILFTALAGYAQGLKVLFIGDSITDGNWGNPKVWNQAPQDRALHDMNHIYGHGFMFLCASHYQGNYPEREYRFYNRGVSGNTLADLEKRWQADVIEIKPDVLTILIGTNDVHAFLPQAGSASFDFAEWEERYRRLLDSALQENKDLKLVLCAPFVANTGSMKRSKDFDQRQALVKQCSEIVERIAKEYKAVYLPFDKLFAELHAMKAVKQETYWIWDGIHPTAAGHQRMADMWIKEAGEML